MNKNAKKKKLSGGFFQRNLYVLIITAALVYTNAEAREYLTYDLADEYSKWVIQQRTNYALSTQGAQASHLFPDHPDFGKKGKDPFVNDGNMKTYSMTSKWVKNSSGRYSLVIQLKDKHQISAFAWYGRPPGASGWGYAPYEYDIRTSIDGKDWKTVAKQRGKRVYQNIHIFDPVEAKYIAMDKIKASTHFRGTIIHEVGVYDLTEKTSGTTINNPPWWNDKCRFRVRVNDIPVSNGKISGSIDFTDILKDRMALQEKVQISPIDLSSIKAVHCIMENGKCKQYPVPTEFTPDARFNLNKFAVGKLSWKPSIPLSEEGTWWVYMNVINKQDPKIAEKREDKAFQLDLPVWNYHRGSIISGQFTINTTKFKEKPNKLVMSLVDSNNEYQKTEYSIDPKGQDLCTIHFKMPAKHIACGDYGLKFSILGKDNNQLYQTEADVVIAPRKKHHMEFTVYGWPEYSRMNTIRWTRCMSKLNITASNGGGRNTTMDEATAYNMNMYARGPNEGLYPPKSQLIVTKDGDAVPISRRHIKGYCHNDPNGLKKMYRLVKKKAQELTRYGSFRGFSCFDDHAFPMVKKDGTWKWTCYCRYCKERYKQKFNKPIPDLSEISWKTPIVPDDDPALLFIEDRCRSMGDYVANYEKAKAEVNPNLEIGQMMMRNVMVHDGDWPPFHLGPASVASMYDYVSCAGTLLGYFTLYEYNQMGNRDKKAWMLFECADQSKGWRTGHWNCPLPIWAVRAGFWHNLAAGNKTLGMFGAHMVIGQNPKFDAEIKALGSIIKRIGPLLGQIQPTHTKVAILASFPDFSQPDNPRNSNNAKRRIDKVYFSLLKDNIPCEIVSDNEAKQGYLSNYDIIIVPDIKYIRQSAYDALVDFKKKGGTLFVQKGCAIKIPGSRVMPIEEIITETAVYLKQIPANTGTPNAVYREFNMPGGKLFVVINCEAEVSGQLRKFRWGKMEMIQAKPVEMRMKIDSPELYCYDLVEGKLLPQGDDKSVALTLAPGGGKVLAYYEQPIERIVVYGNSKSAKLGSKVLLRIGIYGNRKLSKADHLIRIQIFEPDGKENNEYSNTILAKKGEAEYCLPLAVNDAVGKWSVKITELASNLSTNTVLIVNP